MKLMIFIRSKEKPILRNYHERTMKSEIFQIWMKKL